MNEELNILKSFSKNARTAIKTARRITVDKNNEKLTGFVVKAQVRRGVSIHLSVDVGWVCPIDFYVYPGMISVEQSTDTKLVTNCGEFIFAG